MRHFIFSDGKAAYSSWQNISSCCSFLGSCSWTTHLRSPQSSMILGSGDWYGHSRTSYFFSAVAIDMLTWPCVLDPCHAGMSKSIPCPVQLFLQYSLITCCIHFAITFGHVPCACVAHTSPKHPRSISVFHSGDGVLFIMFIVDSSLNVIFMVVAKMFWFHHSKYLRCRSFEACLCAVWYIVRGLFCSTGQLMAFFWPLDHAAHFSSGFSLLCILIHPLHFCSESPVCHLKLFVGFCLYPEKCSWQFWLKLLLVYLNMVWF